MKARLFYVVLLLTFLILPSSAQTAPWFAVVWARGADQLLWITAAGEAARIPRPMLPEEEADSLTEIEFSRDGRYLLQASENGDGYEALGIYDLVLGRFTGNLTAQSGMRIHLGGPFATNEDLTHVAVGFATDDVEDGTWQIIVFELASGAATAFLDSSQAAQDAAVITSYPLIRLYGTQDETNEELIHFQLVPKFDEVPSTLPAYGWLSSNVSSTQLQSSPIARSMSDLDLAGEQELFAFEQGDLLVAAFSAVGSSYNAIGKKSILSSGIEPEIVYSDQQRFLSFPRWAKGDEWIAVYTESGEQGVSVGWQLITSEGAPESKQLVTLPADVRDVYGTPDGLLTLTTDGTLRHVTNLSDVSGTVLFQPPSDTLELLQILYVSQGTGDFTASDVASPSP